MGVQDDQTLQMKNNTRLCHFKTSDYSVSYNVNLYLKYSGVFV